MIIKGLRQKWAYRKDIGYGLKWSVCFDGNHIENTRSARDIDFTVPWKGKCNNLEKKTEFWLAYIKEN